MYPKRVYVCLVVLFAAVGAFAQDQARGPLAAPGLDGRFVELSGQVPGFGGYFFDEKGDLNVYLTDVKHEPAARAALAGVARSRAERRDRPWSRAAEIVVRRGDFDFAQLDEWRGRLASIAASTGVHLLDTDETANRLFVGAENEKAKERVLARLDAIGVPRNAVVVEVTPAAVQIATLRDNVRPLVGGLHIDWNTANGTPTYCTLGVNVWYTNYAQGVGVGTLGFYTASHCSATYGGTDGTVYAQGGSRIGYERWDPPFYTNAQNTRCPVGWPCRSSDVAFVQYDAGVNRYQGGLAQTTYRGLGNWQVGSIDINSTYPHFRINSTVTPVVGNYLEKVGRTTGWTAGQISRVCADYFIGGVGMLCQDQVEAFADGGDSGSPVFGLYSGNDVSFAGIVWAKTGTGAFVFSNLDRIQYDMGGGANYLWY